MIRSRIRITALVALTLALSACEPEAPPAHRFQLSFQAVDDRGEPVAGVALSLAGQPIGATGEGGGLGREVRAPDGHVAALGARCPDGYLEAVAPEQLTLRVLRGLDDGGASELTISITCPRAERRAAIVVRADGQAGLPVLVDGVPRAVTDASGVAHVALAVPPRTELRVALDTEGRPRLEPQSPFAVFSVTEADEVFVFDQPFALERPRPRRRPRPKAAEPEPPAPKRPIRVD